VHFPVVFLLAAFGLDILHLFHASLPDIVASSSLLPPANELPRLAYLSLSAGLLTALPAALSGMMQAAKVVARTGGPFDATGKMLPRVYAIVVHALMADTVVLTSAWVWWRRHTVLAEHEASLAAQLGLGIHLDSAQGNTCGGAAAEKYAAEPWIIGVEAVLASMLLLTADAGGSLTYQHGVGLSIFGTKKNQ